MPRPNTMMTQQHRLLVSIHLIMYVLRPLLEPAREALNWLSAAQQAPPRLCSSAPEPGSQKAAALAWHPKEALPGLGFKAVQSLACSLA